MKVASRMHLTRIQRQCGVESVSGVWRTYPSKREINWSGASGWCDSCPDVARVQTRAIRNRVPLPLFGRCFLLFGHGNLSNSAYLGRAWPILQTSFRVPALAHDVQPDHHDPRHDCDYAYDDHACALRIDYLILHAHLALVPWTRIIPSPANHVVLRKVMTSFSSSSSCALPPPGSPASSLNTHHRNDVGLRFRPQAPPTTRHTLRHQPSSAGSRARYLDWNQDQFLPSSSKVRDFSPRNSMSDAVGHASEPFAAQTPPTKSKVRSYSGARLSNNEISPAFRFGGVGCRMPGSQVHQSQHAPNGCTTRLRPRTEVPSVSLNEPPSLSSSLTSPAPSLSTPPTPQSQRSLVRDRRRSAFVIPSASVASFRTDSTSFGAAQPRCERYTPSPSPLSHASREPRTGSHR